MLEQALRGARLLFAYTIFMEAPVEEAFKYTAEPEYWTRDFNGDPLPNLKLVWEGKKYKPGSVMMLSPLRKDGTPTPVGAVRMELLHYARDEELSFRFLNGNHLIYRFVYEKAGPNRTEFTVNVLVDNQSPYINTVRQRLYAKRRRKEAIKNHLRAKANIEARFRPKRSA
jgi:hypothetical protein